VNYASQVLRNEVLVAAFENLFVPVLIYTSTGTAHDQAMLKEFKEPAWNNPVARFLDADRKDLIARKDGVYSAMAMAERVIAALDAAKANLPADARATLQLVAKGQAVSAQDARKFADLVSTRLSRQLAPSLAAAVKAYEAREYGKSAKLATKVSEGAKSSDEEKTDAKYLDGLIKARFEGVKAKAEGLKSQREYLELFELVDGAAKQFEGMTDDWLPGFEELKKDKDIANEVKALKALTKLTDRLAAARDDKERQTVNKQLGEFAAKNPGTRAAEKATELAK